MMKQIISVDLGGTRIRAARFDRELNLLARQEIPTQAEQGFPAVLERIKNLIDTVMPLDRSEVTGIGICVPGQLNPVTGIIYSAGNLPECENIPIVSLLQASFHVSVYVGNDANMAALAEAAQGAARGYQNIIYLTISTGIGSGIITDGKLLLGQDGIGAEIGFMLMFTGNQPHTIQDRAAGPGIAREARGRIERGTTSQMSEWVQGDLTRIDSHMIGEAAKHGDVLARDVIQWAGCIIGLGVTNLVHLFNPQIIVIGGGVSNFGEFLFTPIRETIQQYSIPAYWENLKIAPAQLGDNAGLVGAAALVLEGRV